MEDRPASHVADRKASREVREEENQRLAESIEHANRLASKTSKKKAKSFEKKRRLDVTSKAQDEENEEETGDESDEEEKALLRMRLKKKETNSDQPSEDSSGDSEAEELSDGEDDLQVLDNAILQRWEDVKLDLPFEETLSVVSKEVSESFDTDDDLKREVAFYRQAMDAVRVGRSKLEEAKVPHFRPKDYFAEMIKSDAHMARIKQNLLFEKKKIEAFEQRKKQREYKKFAKQVQAKKTEEKASFKKKTKELANEFRAKNKSSDSAILSTGKRKMTVDGSSSNNARRAAKNARYGFGEKKIKKNTADSTGSWFASDKSGKGNFRRQKKFSKKK